MAPIPLVIISPCILVPVTFLSFFSTGYARLRGEGVVPRTPRMRTLSVHYEFFPSSLIVFQVVSTCFLHFIQVTGLGASMHVHLCSIGTRVPISLHFPLLTLVLCTRFVPGF